MELFKLSKIFRYRESGMTLLETAIAVAILGTIAAAFLGGVATSSRGVYTADERSTAKSLARTQMEWVKTVDYNYDATGYSIDPIPVSDDYINYSANITAEPLHVPDDGIQKITVTIMRSGEAVFALEGYKVDR